jgi:pyruvate dehydrogenase E1 component beta subunit
MTRKKQPVETTYREAMREALAEALRTDERVFLMGEDIGAYGGCYGVTTGLLDEFGPDRVRDRPRCRSPASSAPGSVPRWAGCGPSWRS